MGKQKKRKKLAAPPARKPGTGLCVRAVWADDPAWAAVVDDDGARVAYAYLLKEGAVVSEVWLYNRGVTPAQPEWRAKDAQRLLPFKNPAPLVVGSFTPLAGAGEVKLEWRRTDDGPVEVDLLLRGKLHARLREGERPGRCALAREDGLIARRLGPTGSAGPCGVEPG